MLFYHHCIHAFARDKIASGWIIKRLFGIYPTMPFEQHNNPQKLETIFKLN